LHPAGIKKPDTRERIGQVASLSAHEEAIGETIAEAMEKVGKDGVITVKEMDRFLRRFDSYRPGGRRGGRNNRCVS